MIKLVCSIAMLMCSVSVLILSIIVNRSVEREIKERQKVWDAERKEKGKNERIVERRVSGDFKSDGSNGSYC